VGFYGYYFWVTSTANYTLSAEEGVIISTIGELGFVLILVGAIFAGINWSLLRKAGRSTGEISREERPRSP